MSTYNNVVVVSSDVVLGEIIGDDGYDTIRLIGGITLADDAFSQVREMEAISLGEGAYSLNLDENAALAFSEGIVRIAAGDRTNAVVISVDENGPAISVGGSAGNDTIRGSGGDDTLDGGGGSDTLSGGDGDDYIVFNDNNLNSSDSVDGGAGFDVLRLLGGATLADGAFTNLSAIEAISMGSGSYDVVLGTAGRDAFSDGNVRVNAATATDVDLDASSLGLEGYRFIFDGSAGTDRVVIGGNVATITGGAGADAFALQPGSFYSATITDFEDGVDHMVIDGSLLPSSIDTPEEVAAILEAVATETDDGVLLDGRNIGFNSTLFLAGLTLGQLGIDDFLLV